jgi:pyruvyltransferase
LTRRFLTERGIDVPEVFGDPALLLPRLAPELFSRREARSKVTIVPNFNDIPKHGVDQRILDPRLPVEVCLARIAGSEFVTGSSLHGIVVAESLGIPARLVVSAVEHPFKYEDYYLGTGRVGVGAAASVEEAISAGGREPPAFDGDALLNAFPLDLWNAD